MVPEMPWEILFSGAPAYTDPRPFRTPMIGGEFWDVKGFR
jgi:hypothetical protein